MIFNKPVLLSILFVLISKMCFAEGGVFEYWMTDGPLDSGAPYGYTINPDDSVCVVSNQNGQKFDICGRPGFNGYPLSTAPTLRQMVTDTLGFRHSYQHERARQDIEKTDQAIAAFTNYSNHLGAVVYDVYLATEKYANEVAIPATQKISNDIEKRAQNILQSSNGPTNNIDAAPAQSKTSQINDHLNDNGIVDDTLISQQLARSAYELGNHLKTTPNSDQGKQIRHVINRGLIAYSEIPTQSQQVLGAIILATGADLAFFEGKETDAKELLQTATQIVDGALGFLPVLGQINDLTQLVFGMVTGHDYTGHKMEAADYALRGAGIVFGSFKNVAKVAKLGKHLITKSFIEGAELIKSIGKRSEAYAALRNAPEGAEATAKALAKWFVPKRYFSRFESEIAEATDFILKASEGNPRIVERLEKLGSFLAESKVSIKHRAGIARSLELESLELTHTSDLQGKLFIRWWGDKSGETGFYITDALHFSAEEAKKLLALPSGNSLERMTIYRVKPGHQIVKGKAAARYGQPGGAAQYFIHNPEEILEKVDNFF